MTTARPALHLLIAALGLLTLVACAHRWPSSPAAWAGDYTFGQARLQLRATGEFDYQGGSCFAHDSDSDVGLQDTFAGRYRVEQRWIVLEPLTVGPGCSGLGLRLHAVRADGHAYLFDEGYLRAVVNEVRDGRTHAQFPTWHRAGEPDALALPWSQWLPSPYVDWLRQPPPAGRVSAVGPVSLRTRYGSAGRIDGEERSAVLALDIGRRDGAFPGMRVCVDGRAGRPVLDEVHEAQSTLRWRWYTDDGAPPPVGTRVSAACPGSP